MPFSAHKIVSCERKPHFAVMVQVTQSTKLEFPQA